MSGTETTNSTLLALISAMMLLPRRTPSGLPTWVLASCRMVSSSAPGLTAVGALYHFSGKPRQVGGQDAGPAAAATYNPPYAILPKRAGPLGADWVAKSRDRRGKVPKPRLVTC